MSCSSCFSKMGVTGIVDSLRSLFSGGTTENQPELADAASAQPISPRAVQPDDGFQVESTSLAYSLTDEVSSPAAAGGIQGEEGTPLEGAPASNPGAGFGTASTPGGRMLQWIHQITSRPGEPGGSTYGNRAQPVVGSAGTMRAVKAHPTPFDGIEAPAAAGATGGGDLRVGVADGGAANDGIGSHANDWESWGPDNTATEISPWEAGALHAGASTPLPTLSTHPGIPGANAPAHRPAAASTPHVVTSAHTAGVLAKRAADHRLAGQTHAAAHDLYNAGAKTPPAQPPAPAKRRVISKPLSSFRRPLGYRIS